MLGSDENFSASLDNLKLALSSGLVGRIGHGIQIVKGMIFLGESGICFECCLTANAGWKVPSYELHPITQVIHSGLRVTLNCDNTLLSGAVCDDVWRGRTLYMRRGNELRRPAESTSKCRHVIVCI